MLKWVRGEHLSQDHWIDMFRLIGLPKGTTLEKLTFGDIISVSDAIGENASAIKVGLLINHISIMSYDVMMSCIHITCCIESHENTCM